MTWWRKLWIDISIGRMARKRARWWLKRLKEE